MSKLSLTLLALVVATFGANSAQAGFTTTTTFAGTVGTNNDDDNSVDGFLVGTSWDPHNDPSPPTEINAIIGGDKKNPMEGSETEGYNKVFSSPMLAAAVGRIDKFEDTSDPNAGFWTLFDYYKIDSSGSEVWNGIKFSKILNPQADLFGIGMGVTANDEQRVVGLKYVGDPGFDAGIQYLGVKSDASAGGFSAWVYEPGVLNVLYVDADGDQTFIDGEIINGMVTRNYSFDARGDNAVSHISFYGVAVPEPASMAMMGLGGLLVGGALVRRRKRKKS